MVIMYTRKLGGVVGERLFLEWEEGNAQDRYAVIFVKDGTIFGCVLRKLSYCF